MTWTSSSRSRGASWFCTRGASSPTARRTRCAPTRRSRPCTWGRRRGRRDAGAPPGPRLLWSEPRAVQRGPRGAGRGGRLAARPERRRQDDDAQVHRRAGRRDGRRDPVRGTVAARAPHPRDLAPGHRLCAGGPADLRRPHGGREPEGRRAARRRVDGRARLRALPEAPGARRPARGGPLRRRAADADDRADAEDQPAAAPAGRAVGGPRAGGRARARGEHRGPQGQRAHDSLVRAEREVRPAARGPRVHHRERADPVRGLVRASRRQRVSTEGVPQRMKTLIRNIGALVSGDIRRPILEGDSLLIRDGKIARVGDGLDDDADTVIDAKGTTVMPGLIDSHVHPVFGDFTPRQRTVDFIDSMMNGGVTTAISAGEVHLPGRPRDVVGLKALAIVAAKAYANFRPGGVKVHAGAPILELGMVEDDFAEMARAGVKLVGEIGLGSVRTGKDEAPIVKWAKKHGMTVTIHTGGPSIAGSNAISAEVVLEADPDVVGHINGGTTAMSEREIDALVATRMALEIVHCGNGKAALHALRRAREAGATGRIIIGLDAPSGTGVVPLGILRVLAHLVSLGGIAPEEAVCMATGNTARVYKLS